MKKITLYIATLCLCTISFAASNQQYVDSLLGALVELPDDTQKVNVLLLLASEYKNVGGSKALLYALDAKGLAENIGYENGLTDAQFDIGNILIKEGRYTEALQYFLQVSQFYKKGGKKRELAKVFNKIGRLYWIRGDYGKELEYYLAALKIHEELEDKKGIGDGLNKIGNIHLNQGRNERALEYYSQSLALRKEITDTTGIAGSYNNIAIANFNKGLDSLALDYYFKSLTLHEKVDNKLNIGNNLGNIGLVYRKLGEYDLALIYFGKSLVIRKKINDWSGISGSYAGIAGVYERQGKYQQAIEHYKKSLALAIDIEGREWMSGAYRGLSSAYEKQGEFEEALGYHKLYKEVHDSIFNMASAEKIAELQAIYEYDKGKREIELLKQQTELQELEERNQSIFMWALIGTIVFIALLCGLLYSGFRVKHKANELLNQSLQEKELMLKEIHHRVKNNLQLISSLLNLQSSTVQEESVLKALREGQNRVRSMALLHQKLYQGKNFSEVNFKEYLEELTASISESFGRSSCVINYYNVDDVRFDIDTAVPLGLIVNELITNACKYAFGEKNRGTINIGLKEIHSNKYELIVEDDGIGLPKNFSHKNSKTLGIELVSSLTEQLNGEMNYSVNGGTKFIIIFSPAIQQESKTI